LFGVTLGLLPVLQPAGADDREISRKLGQIYDARSSQERDELIGKMLSQGESAEQALRQVARDTNDGRTFWGLASVAQKAGDVQIARILTERLVDPEDRFLPAYLGAGVVMIRGETCYEELKNLALSSAPKVRARIMNGIAYSGYATPHNPVPTLISLAEVLSGEERSSAYDEALSVLEQRGRPVTSETELIQFARCLLPWIFSDQQIKGESSETESMGKCPYPQKDRDRNPPFGVAFDKPSGGRHCYTLSEGVVRKVDFKSLKTELHVNVRCRGEFAGAFFIFGERDSRITSVGILFRRVNDAWKYGGYTRISSAILEL